MAWIQRTITWSVVSRIFSLSRRISVAAKASLIPSFCATVLLTVTSVFSLQIDEVVFYHVSYYGCQLSSCIQFSIIRKLYEALQLHMLFCMCSLGYCVQIPTFQVCINFRGSFFDFQFCFQKLIFFRTIYLFIV